MTPDLANRIADDFRGRTLGDVVVEKYHASGGTSVIMLGRQGNEPVAIKIYEKELFFGENEAQGKAELERIGRQLALKDNPHPNIVRTRAAGQCDETGYHYVVMDFVPDPTLEEAFNDIPPDKIRHIFQQCAKASFHLQETLGYVHRDLKPSNVAVRLTDYHVTVLDLGLVRPVSGDTATDHGARQILAATKRYAPPESHNGSMTRDERGWLAVSIYQLGGILYSLIMRRHLFDGRKDEALVAAVFAEIPEIDSASAPADLVQLALDCLQKTVATRLELVTWPRLLAAEQLDGEPAALEELREAIGRSSSDSLDRPRFPDGAQAAHLREKALFGIRRSIEYYLHRLLDSDERLFPRPTVSFEQSSPDSLVYRISMTYTMPDGPVAVTLFLSCVVIEPTSLLCRCELAACRGDASSAPPNLQQLTILRGSFVPELFSRNINQEIPRLVMSALGF